MIGRVSLAFICCPDGPRGVSASESLFAPFFREFSCGQHNRCPFVLLPLVQCLNLPRAYAIHGCGVRRGIGTMVAVAGGQSASCRVHPNVRFTLSRDQPNRCPLVLLPLVQCLIVGILKQMGRGACCTSALNGKVEVDCAASVFLAANFSS